MVVWKTRPSKTNIFLRKFISITHSTIYHYQKTRKSFFGAQRSLRVLKLLRLYIDRVVFSFHSDRVLFRFLTDSIPFRVFSDRVFFESSVIGSSSGSAVASSLESSVLFFRHAAIFLSNRATTFFIKNRCFVLHYILKKKFEFNN